MFSGVNSLERDRADDAEWLRVGVRNTGIAPVIVIACRIDLWQLRSTTTMSPGATVACHTILFDVDVPLVTKKQWSALKMRAALRSARRDRAGVVEQLAELVDRVADVGAQHVLAEELVEHLPDRALQERDAARVARAVPRVRAVLRVVDQRAEERRRQRRRGSDLRLADDVARDELRRVLEHVDEAVQLAQDVVRDVLRGARLAVQVDRDLGVLEADLLDELAQVQHRRVELGPGRELLVVDRQDEGRCARLCCCANCDRSP